MEASNLLQQRVEEMELANGYLGADGLDVLRGHAGEFEKSVGGEDGGCVGCGHVEVDNAGGQFGDVLDVLWRRISKQKVDDGTGVVLLCRFGLERTGLLPERHDLWPQS
uniref:Tyrosine specific protein phosphatases domain-containing protein n=1 Tax=Mycena chlorophos TaxID=658473 RepID=A0ABQ0L9Y0_MYCCL|nr:predicted protein [Mycena chlorophos]